MCYAQMVIKLLKDLIFNMEFYGGVELIDLHEQLKG